MRTVSRATLAWEGIIFMRPLSLVGAKDSVDVWVVSQPLCSRPMNPSHRTLGRTPEENTCRGAACPRSQKVSTWAASAPSSEAGASLPRRSAVRQPGYLPTRRPLGFAPLPHDGFALLASAHANALGYRHIPNACYIRTIHRSPAPRYTSWRLLPAEGQMPPCCFASRSLMPPY